MYKISFDFFLLYFPLRSILSWNSFLNGDFFGVKIWNWNVENHHNYHNWTTIWMISHLIWQYHSRAWKKIQIYKNGLVKLKKIIITHFFHMAIDIISFHVISSIKAFALMSKNKHVFQFIWSIIWLMLFK
jgi:hypothetical protein